MGTFNLFQYLTHIGGALVDAATGRLQIRRPEFVHALANLAAHRNDLFPTPREGDAPVDTDACCTHLNWTYMFARDRASLRFTPWLFALGEQGAYMEVLNVGVISGTTPYPEECRQFLAYLLSDTVQQELTNVPGEHPVSRRIANPFAAYDPTWQRALHAFRERSQVCWECVPGYTQMLWTVFFPLAVRFFAGKLSPRNSSSNWTSAARASWRASRREPRPERRHAAAHPRADNRRWRREHKMKAEGQWTRCDMG